MSRCYHCNQPAWYQDRETGAFLCPAHGRLDIRAARHRSHDAPPALSVRPSTAADLSAVLEMWQHFWADDGMDCFARVYEAAELPHLLACDREEVVGLLSYAVEREWDAINIVALNVRPEYQGRGGANRLLALLEERTRRSGIGRLIVATSNDNVLALALYQRRGFQISGIRLGAIKPNSAGEYYMGLGGIPVRDEIQLEKRL